MEESFALMKGLKQNWSEITNMESKERNWLLNRLDKYNRKQTAEIEREARASRKKGGLTIEE